VNPGSVVETFGEQQGVATLKRSGKGEAAAVKADGNVKKQARVRGIFPFTVMLFLLVGMVVDAVDGCQTVFKALYVSFALLSLLIGGWALNRKLRYMERDVPFPRNRAGWEPSLPRYRHDLTQHWTFWLIVAGGFLTSVFLIFSAHNCPYQ
jgi:hypothetical protein